MAKRRQQPDELEQLLIQAAESIGSALGKLAVKTGLAKPVPTAPKKGPRKARPAKKTVPPRTPGASGRRKSGKRARKAPAKKAPHGQGT